MNHTLTNEHLCTNIGIHSPPNTKILIPELKYYFLLLSSLCINRWLIDCIPMLYSQLDAERCREYIGTCINVPDTDNEISNCKYN